MKKKQVTDEQKRIEELEAQLQEMQLAKASSIPVSEATTELDKLDRLANKSKLSSLPYSETSDHKNITLYTALNKKVGPLHPDNAREAMLRWRRAGHQLYTVPRTQQEIDYYKSTDKYKKHHQAWLDERKKRKSISRRKSTEDIAKEIGVAVAESVKGG